jgi:hypothetical protein
MDIRKDTHRTGQLGMKSMPQTEKRCGWDNSKGGWGKTLFLWYWQEERFLEGGDEV